MTSGTTVHLFGDIEKKMTNCEGRIGLFADRQFQAQLREMIATAIEGKHEVLSLDVFDTLFLRDNSSELERFLAIGEEMAKIANKSGASKNITAADAFQARYLGTHATYRAREPVQGFREGSLHDIHRIASNLLTGTDALKQAFIEAELEYEASTLTLNPALAAIARDHKKNGGKILLLSDMYMHADHIEKLGAAIGWEPSESDLVVSSADEKISKASGRIFQLAEERMGLSAEDFFHIGDSLKGDFQKPIQHGWKALHLPLSEADIAKRRDSHFRTADKLLATACITTRVAVPH